MKTQRDASLDVVRAAAIMLVICVHSITNSGFMATVVEGPEGFVMLAYWIFSRCCVPLFLMLSGWLMHKKEASQTYYLGYLKLYVPYLLCSAVSLLARQFLFNEQLNLEFIVGSVVNFYACEYAWYMMLYTGLFLLIPFLNIIYNKLESKQQKLLLIFSFVALSHLDSLLNSYVQLWSVWWKNLYPITFYFIGAFMSDYPPRKKASVYFLWMCAALAAFTVFDVFYFEGFAERAIDVNYDHYQILILSLLAFCWLKNISTVKWPEIVLGITKRLSSLSLYIFLLSGISDGIIYPVLANFAPEYHQRYVWTPLTSIISVAMSLIMAMLLSPIGDKLAKMACAVVEKIIFTIKNKTKTA